MGPWAPGSSTTAGAGDGSEQGHHGSPLGFGATPVSVDGQGLSKELAQGRGCAAAVGPGWARAGWGSTSTAPAS